MRRQAQYHVVSWLRCGRGPRVSGRAMASCFFFLFFLLFAQTVVPRLAGGGSTGRYEVCFGLALHRRLAMEL
ncbi:hypothetical protein EDB81DRAFT_229374 [Dactylonectria macrodidyma]|uniref:Uncharacterized protein n=1 Tax=Dactylonectria macrodidyma TaxID=307937 RepID=A0A9P9IJE8_9HYPO|nr:hypothetical protein EDB81DRAFT_229374 [Dactylonectria macrodidyma]